MSILGGLTLVSIVCCFSESYGPYIQRRVVAQQDGLDDKSLRPSTRRVIVQAFTRPARMSRNPLLICFSLCVGYLADALTGPILCLALVRDMRIASLLTRAVASYVR